MPYHTQDCHFENNRRAQAIQGSAEYVRWDRLHPGTRRLICQWFKTGKVYFWLPMQGHPWSPVLGVIGRLTCQRLHLGTHREGMRWAVHCSSGLSWGSRTGNFHATLQTSLDCSQFEGEGKWSSPMCPREKTGSLCSEPPKWASSCCGLHELHPNSPSQCSPQQKQTAFLCVCVCLNRIMLMRILKILC